MQITSISFIQQSIIVGGWFRALALYANDRAQDDIEEHHQCMPKYFMRGLHKEDVLSVTHVEPNMLASASYDGDIFVWNLSIDRLMCRLNAWDEQGRNPQMVKDFCVK